MPPRFNAEARTLELSVADLLETSRLRNLGFAHRGGYERLWMGQAIHGRYQEEATAADPTYRREVGLAHTFTLRGWGVTLRGRADGLRREDDGTRVVEEIKSVRRGSQLGQATRDLYQRQALLYAWLLARAEGVPVRAELVLIEIGTNAVERHPLEVPLERLQEDLERRLAALLAGFERRHAIAAERRELAAGLEFPHALPRPGQDAIVEAVELALQQREHLLLEAPTGIGKTVAAIFPALRFALAHDKRVFVLTAKTLQQEMATEVLAELNRRGAFHTLRMRAKAKMCANEEVLCHEDYCSFARDYGLKLHRSGILDQLESTYGTLLPDAIFEAARTAEVCPFEISLELTSRVQIVVCDYNYAFDPYICFSDFGPGSDLSDTILVIDEIHNLVDRGRGYYSPRLSAGAARRAAEVLERQDAAVPRQVGHLCRELAALIEETVHEALGAASAGPQAGLAPLPEDALWALRPEFDAAFVDYLEYRRETRSHRADDPFIDLYFRFVRFVDGLLVARGEAFSSIAERHGEAARLRILCKDPGRFLGRTLGRCHTVVGLSATLSPSDFYRDLLGFDRQRTVALSVPSPFPADHRRIVIDGSVATTFRQRPDNYPAIAERLGRFADAVPGNCLALFPSYGFLAEVAERLKPERKRVLVQRRADTDREREAILDLLRSAVLGDVLLLAVAGGAFAEGVDYPGEMLRAVAVVGPCLPAVSLELDLLRHYYEEQFERGFEYAFVVPGMTRVIQAAGRLIRSPQDSGVIALFGRRFLSEPYHRYLPGDWLRGAEPEALLGDPAAAAAEFFATTPPSLASGPEPPAAQGPRTAARQHLEQRERPRRRGAERRD